MVTRIQKPVAPSVARSSSRAAPPTQAAPRQEPAAKGWTPQAAQARAPKSAHPLMEKLGEALGLGLGVTVTEGLRLVPGWDKKVVDPGGKPVASVPGASREGDYAIRKRHEEVVGPQLTAKADEIKPGMLHDLVAGLGVGATEAPGVTYRLDAKIDHALHPNKTPGKG